MGRGAYPGIGHPSSLDQNDPLHELDSRYPGACRGVLRVHHFQYPAFRVVQYVPLLSVIPIRTPGRGEDVLEIEYQYNKKKTSQSRGYAAVGNDLTVNGTARDTLCRNILSRS